MNKKIRIKTFNIDKVMNHSSPEDNTLLEEILVEHLEIGNGAYRSIKSILNCLLPIWKQSFPPTLIPGDTLILKLGGDNHN